MIYEKDAFKFCMVCGGEFETLSDIEKHCTKCGYTYFIAAKPSAGALIINDQNEVLLIKRKRNPLKGTWDIPAGFADVNETIEEALKREIKEEVNFDVKNYEYFRSYNGEYEFSKVTKHYLVSVFIIRIDNEDMLKITAGDDAAEFKFVKLTDVNFDEIGFESPKQTIRDYIKFIG